MTRRHTGLLLLLLVCLLLGGCGTKSAAPEAEVAGERLPLQYAENFTAERFENEIYLLTLGGQERFWLLPEGAEIPEGGDRTIPVIRQPVERIYLASSSVADLFLQIDALDRVRFTSTDGPNWRLPAVREALEREEMIYIGKYSAPDYEALLAENCGLVVENTMILHTPETREKLEALGLPVLLEYSSYEPHPLGRVEWIKLYGLLLGKLPQAEAFFAQQAGTLRQVETGENTGKSVAFFHITANGAVVVRRNADYVNRMIQLAGGEPVTYDLPQNDTALSTETIQMESFYAQARDADVLIYNSTVTGEMDRLDQLLQQSELMADFKAVREGQVWCTEQSMFQQTSAAAGMIRDIHAILTDEAGEGETLRFLHKLK
ncbi:MAG: ABC transporter substrate-binding protein [Oscillospiraceae bacterium]|nr:ABC transporter substrate-binding protein [Oscillospiraceae bacterium]